MLLASSFLKPRMNLHENNSGTVNVSRRVVQVSQPLNNLTLSEQDIGHCYVYNLVAFPKGVSVHSNL